MAEVPARSVEALQASRHPLQVWFLIACTISGAGSAFRFGQPPSLLAYMPHFMVSVYGWLVMLGGILGLLGVVWRDRVAGLLMERDALGTVGLSTGIYGIIAYAANGERAWTASTFAVSLAIACGFRLWQIQSELERQRVWMGRHLHWGDEGEGSG